MLRKKPNTEVLAFDDAAKALEVCRKQYPDVLIIDYQLPGMSGIELFDALKSNLPESTVVIMASAIDDGSRVLEFIRAGIRNYVIKDEDFIKSIQEIMEEEAGLR
jgi:two-component system chemotaxis response regulator CheY